MIEWTQVAAQAPGIGILAFVVIKFLAHLDRRDKNLGAAIRENTKAVGDLTVALNGGRRTGG